MRLGFLTAGVFMALEAMGAAGAMAQDAATQRETLEAALPGWLKAHAVPAAGVALIKDGQVAWTLVHGEQSAGVPATPDTLFNVASLAKPLTAELTLRLAAKGTVDLDESMAAHYVDPDLTEDPRAAMLTPAIALSHRTGFTNWRRETDGVLTIRWDPGTRSGYSGEGYNYVGRFLEAKLGTGFEALMAREVFTPLGLNTMALAARDWFDGRLAVPHGPEGAPGKPSVNDAWSAADDLHTTMADYARFMAAVMADDGLTPEIAERRFALSMNLFEEGCPWGPDACPTAGSFTLGWAIFQYADSRVVMQGGGDWGERALAYFVPGTGDGVVIATNSAKGASIIRDVSASLGVAPPHFQTFLDWQAAR